MSYRQDLSLLKDRKFSLLLAARTVSVFGASCAPVALAFGVLELPGATATTLSVVLAANTAPMVAFMLFGGVIGDRFPRQRVMMTGELMNAASCLALSAMLFTHWAPLPALALASAVGGIGLTIFWPALIGVVPAVVPAHQLQSANGLLGLGMNSARIGGMVAGGTMVTLIGAGWALATSGLLFAAAGFLIAALGRRTTMAARPKPQTVLKELRDGWHEFRSRQWLWVVVAQFSVLVMAMQAAHGVLGPVVAKHELGGAKAWSAILVAQAVGMLAGAVIAMRVRPKRPILVATLMMFAVALPSLSLGVNAPLWIAVAAGFAMGVCFNIFGVLWNTTMQREIPAESLSRVSSYDALGSLMFGPLGMLAAGPVSEAVGARHAVLGCAAIVSLATLAALISPAVRNLRARPAEDPQPLVPATSAA